MAENLRRNYKFGHPGSAGRHLVFIKHNDQLILIIDIKVLIRRYFLKQIIIVPNTAGDEVVIGIFTLCHLLFYFLADYKNVVAVALEEVGQLQCLPGYFV